MTDRSTVPAADVVALADTLQDLFWSLRRFGERAAGVTPLPASELEVLLHILDFPDSSVSGIARALGLQGSNVSAAVRSLVGRGLVIRETDAHDRRSVRLHASAEATAAQSAVNTVWVDALTVFLHQLPLPEAVSLLTARPALQRLTALTTPGRA